MTLYDEEQELARVLKRLEAIDDERNDLFAKAEEVYATFREIKAQGIKDVKLAWKNWSKMSPSEQALAGGERMRFFSLELDLRAPRGGRGLGLYWRRAYVQKGTGTGDVPKVTGSKYVRLGAKGKGVDPEALRKLVPEEFFRQVLELEWAARRLRDADAHLGQVRRTVARRAADLRRLLERDPMEAST